MNGSLEGRRVYITTAIDYANGPPHLGHAFEKIGADAMVRYLRLKNTPTRFSIGMDEHGLKVLQSAEAAGKEINATIGIALEDDGAPVALPDAPLRAVRCGLEMQRFLVQGRQAV